MKLRPITRSDTHAAAAMLFEGFPNHSKATWQETIRRLFAYVEQCGEEGSIGYIATAGGRDVGISLAIPGERTAYVLQPRKVVNLAAFYMRPGSEWMTAPFIRRMMKDPSVEYVDLTATPSMREVNRHLGFVDRWRGRIIVPAFISALRPGRGARIFDYSEAAPGTLPDDQRGLLDHHARLHGLALVAEIDGTCHPLILVPTRRRGVPSARVILARDPDLVRRVLGPLSRYLLGRGILFVEFDGCSKAGMPEALFTARLTLMQTTRAPENQSIDHTFTEFMFIPPPNMPAAVKGADGRAGRTVSVSGLGKVAIAAAAATGIALALAEG